MLFYISAEKSPNLRTNLFFVMAYISLGSGSGFVFGSGSDFYSTNPDPDPHHCLCVQEFFLLQICPRENSAMRTTCRAASSWRIFYETFTKLSNWTTKSSPYSPTHVKSKIKIKALPNSREKYNTKFDDFLLSLNEVQKKLVPTVLVFI